MKDGPVKGYYIAQPSSIYVRRPIIQPIFVLPRRNHSYDNYWKYGHNAVGLFVPSGNTDTDKLRYVSPQGTVTAVPDSGWLKNYADSLVYNNMIRERYPKYSRPSDIVIKRQEGGTIPGSYERILNILNNVPGVSEAVKKKAELLGIKQVNGRYVFQKVKPKRLVKIIDRKARAEGTKKLLVGGAKTVLKGLGELMADAPDIGQTNPYAYSDFDLKEIKKGKSFLTPKQIRRNLYDNLIPHGYSDAPRRFLGAIVGHKEPGVSPSYPYSFERDDIWATYLGIPKNERHVLTTPDYLLDAYTEAPKVVKSNYKPTKGSENVLYYKLNTIPLYSIDNLILDGTRMDYGKNGLTYALGLFLGEHTVGKGRDKRGTYVSYYDLWDLAPFGGYGSDQSLGIGKPINFYDRIYLDDYYGIPRDPNTIYLPETVIGYKKLFVELG